MLRIRICETAPPAGFTNTASRFRVLCGTCRYCNYFICISLSISIYTCIFQVCKIRAFSPKKYLPKGRHFTYLEDAGIYTLLLYIYIYIPGDFSNFPGIFGILPSIFRGHAFGQSTKFSSDSSANPSRRGGRVEVDRRSDPTKMGVRFGYGSLKRIHP